MANIVTRIWEMEDLRKRVLFTLGMLAVYRLGIYVPAPGINRAALQQFFNEQSNTLFGLYNMFSGGALQQFSVFVLGIMPYITASIMVQILTKMVPALERIQKEGQQGKNRMTQYTRYLTIIIAVMQSSAMAAGMEQMRVGTTDVVINSGWDFRAMTVLTMTAGACFVMWLSEQMTDRGIGNGASILITSGIIAGLPAGVLHLMERVHSEEMNLLGVAMLAAFMFTVVMGIVFVERGQMRIPIQYAKKVLGRKVYPGRTDYLPLKVNISGVIPPIFASSLLMFPSTIGQFYPSAVLDWVAGAFYPGRWLYNLSYAGLIIFFAYFYTAVTFPPEDLAENLKKQGGYIPRVRPGAETISYLDWLLTRLTAVGAVYLSAVCILPSVLVSAYNVPFSFGGTGLLIVVGVSLDTVAQVEAQLMTKHYDGLIGPKAQRVKGRRRLMAKGDVNLLG